MICGLTWMRAYKEVSELYKCTGRAHNRDCCLISGAIKQLPCKHCGSLVAVPELAGIPVLSKSVHGQFPLKVIFRL